MEQLFFDECKQVRDELCKTIQNMVPLGGPDWQEWNKARRIKIRTDVESLLIMYDQCVYKLKELSELEEKETVQNRSINPLIFNENE